MTIQNAYNAFATNDVKGPNLVSPIPDNMKIKERNPTLPAIKI